LINSPASPWPPRAIFFPPDITLSQGHGRHETREVYPFAVTPETTGFPYAAQAAIIHRITHHLKSRLGTEDTEIVLTSRPADKMDADHIQKSRRGHWTLENPIHYVRDVTFQEDRSTARTGHLIPNLATLRNLVIGLCALDNARQGQSQRNSYLPRFRCAAKNNHQIAIDLLARPLLNGH
jgi:hypothetical protein